MNLVPVASPKQASDPMDLSYATNCWAEWQKVAVSPTNASILPLWGGGGGLCSTRLHKGYLFA